MRTRHSTSALAKLSTEISRIFLGGTFLFSGFVKSVDVYGTAFKITDYLHAFSLGGLSGFSTVFSFLLIGLEFLLGLMILLGIYSQMSSRLAVLTISFMTLLTLYIAVFNPVDDCGCFGDAFTLSNWHTFYKNILLLVCSIILCSSYSLIFPLFSEKARLFVLGYCALFTGALLLYNYMYDPLFDFRPYHVGATMKKTGHSSDESINPVDVMLIYEKGGVQKAFSPEDSPWQDSTWIYRKTEIRTPQSYTPNQNRVDFSMHKLVFNINHSEIMSQIDITDTVLSVSDYSFFWLFPDLSEISTESHEKFSEITKYATCKGYTVYCLTASPSMDIVKKQNMLPENVILCSMDSKTLRTVVRTPPGLMLMKDGIIVAKWSKRSLPDHKDLTQSLENLISGSPPAANIVRFIFAVLMLAFPLAILRMLEHLMRG